MAFSVVWRGLLRMFYTYLRDNQKNGRDE